MPPADDDGLADPFFKIWDLSGKAKNSKNVENSLDPIFYEVQDFMMDVFLPKKDENNPQAIVEGFPPFIIDIWDSDKGMLDNSNDFMARATIFAEDASCRYIIEDENTKKIAIAH